MTDYKSLYLISNSLHQAQKYAEKLSLARTPIVCFVLTPTSDKQTNIYLILYISKIN